MLQRIARLLQRVRAPRLLGMITIVRRLLALQCRLLLRIPAQTQSSPQAHPEQDDPPSENDRKVAVHPVYATIGPYGYEDLVKVVVWPGISDPIEACAQLEGEDSAGDV